MNFVLCVFYYNLIFLYLKTVGGQKVRIVSWETKVQCLRMKDQVNGTKGRWEMKHQLASLTWVTYRSNSVFKTSQRSQSHLKKVTLYFSSFRNQLDKGDDQSDPHQGGPDLGTIYCHVGALTVGRNADRAWYSRESERPTLLYLPPPYSILPQVVLQVQGQGELIMQGQFGS